MATQNWPKRQIHYLKVHGDKDKLWHLCKHHKHVNTKGKKKGGNREREGEFLPGSDQIRSLEQDPIEKENLLRLFSFSETTITKKRLLQHVFKKSKFHCTSQNPEELRKPNL